MFLRYLGPSRNAPSHFGGEKGPGAGGQGGGGGALRDGFKENLRALSICQNRPTRPVHFLLECNFLKTCTYKAFKRVHTISKLTSLADQFWQILNRILFTN